MDSNPGQITLSDGEGTVNISPISSAKGKVIIARNGEAFKKTWGYYPDYEIKDSTPAVLQAETHGNFQLANKKDELSLIQSDKVIQQVSWPADFKARQGQVHFSDSEGHWDNRILMAGGSSWKPSSFYNLSGTAFTSPDCSRKVMENLLSGAKYEILLNVYEFTDKGFGDLLADAVSRGVNVTVLLEGGPVGGIPAEEFPVIHKLTEAGARVMLMESTDEQHAPYRYDHAKYIVTDQKSVFITTENFKTHSFPPSGYSGNRGWGVLIYSPEVAAYFSGLFNGDINGPGIIRASGRAGDFENISGEPYNPVFATIAFTDAEVTPVLSPDTSYLIADMINKSSKRVWIEQAYITEYPEEIKNPFLAAAINAARRGADVRILLDGYYYNIEGDQDNDEMVTSLQTLASGENIPLQAKILYPERNNLLKLHTKGVIADDSVLISSMNWNQNSACFNREAGVIIISGPVASYFASVFLQDWSGTKDGNTGQAGDNFPDKEGLVKVIQVVALGGILIFLILLYRRYHK